MAAIDQHCAAAPGSDFLLHPVTVDGLRSALPWFISSSITVEKHSFSYQRLLCRKKYILRHYLLKQLKLHFTKHVIYLGKSKQITLFNTITEWLDVALIGQNITCVGISNVRYFGVSFLQTYEYYP